MNNENGQRRLENIVKASTGELLMLKIDVLYTDKGPNRYTMAGYKYAGQPIIRFEYADRFNLTEKEIESVLKRNGWVQEGRPVRQAGFAYHYFYKRLGTAEEVAQDGDLPFVYSLSSLPSEDAERKRQRLLFQQWQEQQYGDSQQH